MAKIYNVNIIGNLTNNNGVLSGFSSSNYASLPTTFNPPQTKVWEILLKVKTGETFNGMDTIFCRTKNNYYGIRIHRNSSNGCLRLSISRNGTTEHTTDGTIVLQTNRDYWVKVTFNGTGRYELSLSTDGINYALEGYILQASLLLDSANPTYIGNHNVDSTRVWSGTIDLNESYININNAIWWQGVTRQGVNPKIQLRHDTAANWTSVNPVLLEGEVGIETDTRKQKFGDGTTAWNSLPYDVGSTALQGITSSNVTNALGYTPVNKAGDTITGTLNLSNDLILLSGGVYMSAGNTSKGTAPANDAYQAFFFRDADSSHTTWQSQRFGACEIQILNSGENRLMLRVYRNQTDSTSGATLMLGVDVNDNQWCTFPNTTCCDGQWVHSQLIAGTSVAKGTYNVSLSSYLPNDGHMYEVMINLRVYSSSSSNPGEVFVYSDVFSETQYNNVNISGQGGAGGYSRQIGNTFILPVGTQRTITYKIESNAVTNLDLVLWGYRRIGSNA